MHPNVIRCPTLPSQAVPPPRRRPWRFQSRRLPSRVAAARLPALAPRRCFRRAGLCGAPCDRRRRRRRSERCRRRSSTCCRCRYCGCCFRVRRTRGFGSSQICRWRLDCRCGWISLAALAAARCVCVRPCRPPLASSLLRWRCEGGANFFGQRRRAEKSSRTRCRGAGDAATAASASAAASQQCASRRQCAAHEGARRRLGGEWSTAGGSPDSRARRWLYCGVVGCAAVCRRITRSASATAGRARRRRRAMDAALAMRGVRWPRLRRSCSRYVRGAARCGKSAYPVRYTTHIPRDAVSRGVRAFVTVRLSLLCPNPGS